MKAVIIEDEQRASKRLKKLIESMDSPVEIVACLASVTQSLEWFRTNPAPDFIVSDIQLGDGRAFEIFQELSDIPPVIFTTAYDEFALKAFQNNGIDYLLKPIDPEELNKAIQKLKNLGNRKENIDLSLLEKILSQEKRVLKSRFMIKIGDKLKSISLEEINAFYSFEGGTYLKTSQGRSYSIDYSMDQLEEDVDPVRFFRINRALMLNFDSIETIHIWSGSRLKIELQEPIKELDGDVLVSRDRVREFKKWLDR